MLPPVAVQVTAGVADDPSLHEPDTVNCWVPPGARDTEDGLRTSSVSVGGGTAMVIALVSALVPPVWTAITRYVPAVLPAVRSEEHTSELQSRGLISYAVFCLKK